MRSSSFSSYSFSILLLALLSSSAPALVPAARVWSSDGSRASWDDSYIDAGDGGPGDRGRQRVLRVPPRALNEDGAAVPAVVPGPVCTTPRCTTTTRATGAATGARSYGFAFRLQQDWDFTRDVSFNLAQVIAGFTDLDCTETWMPSTMVYLYGNQLTSRVKHGNVCPQDQQQTTYFNNLATVTAGVWHKVVLEVSWESDSAGTFNLWFDGQQAAGGLPRTGIPTTAPQDREFQFRVGLYANGWKQGMSVSQPFRQVWFDRISTGDTPADVDPDNWSG